MKKYIVPFLFVALIVGCLFCFGFSQNKEIAAAEYKVYVTNLDEITTNINSAIVVDLGFCFEVGSEKAIEVAGSSKLIGKSEVFYCKVADLNRIFDLMGFTVFEKYNLNDILVFEGKNNKGQRMQAAFGMGKLTVGVPAIIGGY